MVSTSCPSVSVIVPVYNDPDRLESCLAALTEQTYPRDRFEVVVIDNGSEPPVRTVLADSDRVLFVEERCPSSYAARNRGLARSRGEVVAFCDADCLPHPDWLERGVARLDRAAGAQVVGGRIDVFTSDAARPSAVELYELVTTLRQKAYVEHGGFAATANLFAYRSVFEEVGPFDEVAKSCGDVEWCQRAAARGYPTVYADDARVRHPARSSWRELRRKVARITGGMQDMRRRRPVRFVSNDRTAVDRLVPLPFALRLMRDPRLRSVRERLAVASVAFVVRYLEVWERIRLMLGGVSRR